MKVLPNDAVEYEFDSEEARGKILIEPGPYGVNISVNGGCLAMVDLFHMAGEGRKYPQLVIYTTDDTDEPLGHIRWMEETVVAEFDSRTMRHKLNREMRAHELVTTEGENE